MNKFKIMKKKILTIVSVFAVAMAVQAQTPAKSPAGDFRFGFKGGYNLANIGGDVEDNKSLSGFHLGGFVEIPVSEKFAIQPEVLYSAQGAKYKETDFGVTYEWKTKLDYINIPVMAKYYVLDQLSIEAGPQFGFLVKAEADGEDYKEYTKSFEFGLGIGASYYFTENFFAGARYNLGLSNIAKDSGDFKIHNNVLQVSVGYRF